VLFDVAVVIEKIVFLVVVFVVVLCLRFQFGNNLRVEENDMHYM